MNAPLSREAQARFRDLDAERQEARWKPSAEPRAAEAPVVPRVPARLRVCVLGFTAGERQILSQLEASSLHQATRLELLPLEEAHGADLVMADGSQSFVRRWARTQSWLDPRDVFWVDAPADMLQRWSGRTRQPVAVARPLKWSALVADWCQAVQARPQRTRDLQLLSVQPGAPAVMLLAQEVGDRLRWTRWLEAEGWRVMAAATAREGLAALHAARYHGVIACEGLTDGDAPSLAVRLRRLQPRIGAVPMLWVGPEPGPWERLRARMVGFDDFASPPRRRRDLKALLRRFQPSANPPGAVTIPA